MALDIAIRPCHSDECATIMALWRNIGSTPSISDSINALRRLVEENSDLFLVAEYDNRIVGTIIGGWDGWRGSIYRLAVLPEYRRQGIGRALVREIEQRLTLKGAKKLSILVEYEDDLAVAFWNALEDTGYIRDQRIVRYAKIL